MLRAALDRPRTSGAEMAGEKDGKPRKTESGLDWPRPDTRIRSNRWNRKIAHGEPVRSFKGTAIRMPGSNIHFHQSGFEYRLKRKPKTQSTKKFTPRQRRLPPPPSKRKLLHFDRCADIDELLLDRLGFVLIDAFLDWFRRAVHQILGFLQPQTGDFPHRFDDVDLIGA